jgi:hypothetical protein
MPCSDGRDNIRVEYEKGHDPHYREEARRLSARCAELTDLLCKAGRARYTKSNIPQSVLKWWEEHCEIDRKRGEPW